MQVDPGESLKSFTLTTFVPNDPAYTATFHMYDGPTQSDPVLGTEFASFDGDMTGLSPVEEGTWAEIKHLYR